LGRGWGSGWGPAAATVTATGSGGSNINNSSGSDGSSSSHNQSGYIAAWHGSRHVVLGLAMADLALTTPEKIHRHSVHDDLQPTWLAQLKFTGSSAFRRRGRT
jgi:hypothetical protein